MLVKVYGPNKESPAIAELLRHIPATAQSVVIQAPYRREKGLKACQRPGVLEMVASVDNALFIHLSQQTEASDYVIKITS